MILSLSRVSITFILKSKKFFVRIVHGIEQEKQNKNEIFILYLLFDVSLANRTDAKYKMEFL